MKRPLWSILLGISHGAADGTAGLLLLGLLQGRSLIRPGELVLIYNLLAFGAQPLVGALSDRWDKPRRAAIIGLAALGCALPVAGWNEPLAVLLAGLGSAAFHTGGGAIALCESPHESVGAGFFTAPGVFGLALGSALAVSGCTASWPWLLALLICAVAVALPALPAVPLKGQSQSGFDSSRDSFSLPELALIALLIATVLRSTIWTSYQLLFAGQASSLLILATSAAGGKLLGGLLADKFGWKRWGLGALLAAALLLVVGQQNFVMLALGIGLLQSTTPLMLAAVGQV
ncbi:MFS transporter, partial [Chloroflexota bacterium]